MRDKSDRELIQGVPAVTICFFILGPLPQAIKIFGAHGLYWTKAWAAVLFSAWVWEVMVRFIAALPRSVKVDTDGVGSRVRSRDLKQLSRILYQIDFMAQFAVWLWILVILSWSRAPREYIGFFFGALLWVVGLVYGGLLLGIALVILLLYALSSISRLAATIFLICASVGWTVYWFYAVYLMDWSYAILLWLIRVSEALSLVVGLPLLSGTIYLFVSASTALLLAFDSILVILGQEVEGSLEREPFLSSEADTQSDDQTLMTHQRRTSLGANEEGQNVSSRRITRCSARSAETIALGKFFHRRKLEVHQNRRVRAITFALANLLFTSLYYFFKYYSYGTVKPSWTDMLG